MSSRVVDAKLARVPGWFRPLDRQLFAWFLGTQQRSGATGDLAELGVYLGKSAILMGDFLHDGERFVVVDLFGEEPEDADNARENKQTYPTLSQEAFEANYRSFHADLPHVVRGYSSLVLEHARHGMHRFVHIDASHLYEHVRADLHASQLLLGEQGVVVLDDFRQVHTPGVAAAAWQAVSAEGLHVLALSEDKLYGTWSDPTAWRHQLSAWLPTSGFEWEEQVVLQEPLLRVWRRPPVSPVRSAVRAVVPPRLRALMRVASGA